MVIASKDGMIFVLLADGEFLPENLNSEKAVVMRRGPSTGQELLIVKPIGQLANPELLKKADEPVCDFEGVDTPLHQHRDNTWWFYDETWAFENGPYDSEEDGNIALEMYCRTVLASREPEPAEGT